MTPPVPPVYQLLDRVLTREVPAREFGRWVCDSRELEAELGSRDYLRLRRFPYARSDAAHELHTIVAGIYQRRRPGMLVPDRVWRLACGLASGVLPLVPTAHRLAALWYAGHTWIPMEFVGIASELAEMPQSRLRSPWNPGAPAPELAEWQPRLDRLAGDAAVAARRLLRRHFPGAPCPAPRGAESVRAPQP